MRQYNSSEIYNSETGLVQNQYQIKNVLEDIWIPRGHQESKNTEVSTLESGKALQDKMETVDWFKKKLYKAFGIPESRLSTEATYQFGRSAEITRDEVRFAKMVNVYRRKFSEALIDILKKQLILRKVVTEKEWDEVKKYAEVKWHGVSYFREMKSLELWDARLNMLDRMNNLVGTYVCKDFVYENVLRMTPAEAEEQKKKIEQDKKAGELVPAATGAIGNAFMDPDYEGGATDGQEVTPTPIEDVPSRELDGLEGDGEEDSGGDNPFQKKKSTDDEKDAKSKDEKPVDDEEKKKDDEDEDNQDQE
jgi:hypothetical protein